MKVCWRWFAACNWVQQLRIRRIGPLAHRDRRNLRYHRQMQRRHHLTACVAALPSSSAPIVGPENASGVAQPFLPVAECDQSASHYDEHRSLEQINCLRSLIPVRWMDNAVTVVLTRQAVKNSPACDPERTLDREHEAALFKHHGPATGPTNGKLAWGSASLTAKAVSLAVTEMPVTQEFAPPRSLDRTVSHAIRLLHIVPTRAPHAWRGRCHGAKGEPRHQDLHVTNGSHDVRFFTCRPGKIVDHRCPLKHP